MHRIKDAVLREFGDEGADTLERYFAQIEYIAFWCIRMLWKEEGILAVVPEVVQDVIIIRSDVHELHQVKTRDESQVPWTTAEVLPILCKQYHGRTAFSAPCCYHFVSDHRADPKTKLQSNSYGALYRLKVLLDIQHEGDQFNDDEQTEWDSLKRAIVPQIQHLLQKEHKQEVDEAMAVSLLTNTYIRTDTNTLRQSNNITDLGYALQNALPGTTFTLAQLGDIYDRLLLLIIRKIFTKRSDSRRIEESDILNCCSIPSLPLSLGINLDLVPGETNLDKKLYLGGFDATEMRPFHKQKVLASGTVRELETLGDRKRLEKLSMALIDQQVSCRHIMCRENGITERPGPSILATLRSSISTIARRYFPDNPDVDEQFCLGLLWNETNLCTIWWNALNE